MLDVTPQTLGIGTAGGFMEPLVVRNTPIPTMASKVFHTASDNQTEVRIRVYQGDSRDSMKNYMLGEFILDGLPPGLRGEVKIAITFAIDANGIVNVTAEDSQTGNARRLRVEASSNLSAGQVADLQLDDDAVQSQAPLEDSADDDRDLFAAMDKEEAGELPDYMGESLSESAAPETLELDDDLLDLDPETEELSLDDDTEES